MDFLKDVLIENWQLIIIILCSVIGIQFIIFIIMLIKTNKLESRYRKLMRGTSNKNLETLVVEYLEKVEDAKQSMDNVVDKFNTFDERLNRCVQKTAIKRYQAFNDVGSDLSYSIALLDYENDGVIITSIYGRSESTSYAKPIDKGISRYSLSEEEEEVLNKAINNYNSKKESTDNKK